MSSQLVIVERRDRAAFVILNRPAAANALSRPLVSELTTAVSVLAAEIAAGADVRSLVLTGMGDRAFSAGADLKERQGWTVAETRVFLDELNALMNAVAGFPRPVVASLNGVAFGGGLELALAADIRISSDAAEIGLTEVRLGIIPGAGGTQRLGRIAGVGVAKDLILTGRRITATRARELGIVSEIVPRAELATATTRWVAEIAAAAPLALAAAKLAIDDGAGRALTEGLRIERSRYEDVLVTADRNEGLAAFAGKRVPVYQGR